MSRRVSARLFGVDRNWGMQASRAARKVVCPSGRRVRRSGRSAASTGSVGKRTRPAWRRLYPPGGASPPTLCRRTRLWVPAGPAGRPADLAERRLRPPRRPVGGARLSVRCARWLRSRMRVGGGVLFLAGYPTDFQIKSFLHLSKYPSLSRTLNGPV